MEQASTATIVSKKSKHEESEDLSAQIVRDIERAPGDQVTCRRIYGDNYRCNWWQCKDTSLYDNPGMLGLLVTTFRIRKSQFIRVTKSAVGLQYESRKPRA
jgi:hypothetical protein